MLRKIFFCFRRRGFIYLLLRKMLYENHLPFTLLLLFQLYILKPFIYNFNIFYDENNFEILLPKK
jgi:hypothetical protein